MIFKVFLIVTVWIVFFLSTMAWAMNRFWYWEDQNKKQKLITIFSVVLFSATLGSLLVFAPYFIKQIITQQT